MSAPVTPTDGTSWALTTLSTVPADRHVDRAGTVGAGRHVARYSLAATILTATHQSWIRRDLVWVWPVLVLVTVLGPH